ncbi:MAG TPA: DUF1036 domain-containing protein [Xanthobacteraceae bacterium]|nr:DUF1036 domain-containing protein [Xanthobacteraceae bacterium]
MRVPARWTVLLAAAMATAGVGAARADLQLCNRTSYVLDLALGLETSDTTATRGWFRVDPGGCKVVLQGSLEAGRLYLHARPHAVYREPPLPLAQHARLCVAESDFIIAGAKRCPSRGQYLADFTAVNPSQGEGGLLTASVGERAGYDAAQARLAAVQRLLSLLGYDAQPVDGLEGRKTEAALAQFLRERKLGPEAAAAPSFFDTLLAAARGAARGGFSWCNDTAHVVMAALGAEENGAIVTRGWYRVTPGRCLKPDLVGRPRQIYSFAEAVDDDGRTIRRGDRALQWGGPVTLCTRPLKFEIAEQRDCARRGLSPAGFVTVELPGGGATVRFKE